MNYYDSIARGYNELYYEEQFKKWYRIKDLIKFKGKVLDLGCGTGFITKLLPNVIGVDSSIKMLELCPKDLETVHASLEELPFSDNSFDIIFSLTVLQDIHNVKKAVSEIKRVLKPSGKLLISVLNKKKVNEIRKELKKKFPKIKEKNIKKDIVFFL